MRTEVPLLTKSDYVAGLKCQKRLYLKKYHRDLEAPLEAGAKARMSDGQEVGALARMLFPGGVLIEGLGEEAVELTKRSLSLSSTLFEAQFVSGGRTVRVDVLQNLGSTWRILEVKSSKAPKDGDDLKSDHLHDVAFQVLVLREAGIDVRSAGLMLLSRDYIAPASGVDPAALFTIVDVTNHIEELLMDTQFNSIRLMRVLQADDPPEVETNTHCSDCGFHGACHQNQLDDDLVFLPRVKPNLVSDLRQRGVFGIGDIPNDVKLSATQMRVRNVYRDGKPYVDSRLLDVLSDFRYPVHFIDFEATKWVIPTLEGTAPHQAIPFQWSCHVLREAGAELEHYEYLRGTAGDPRQEFATTLWECCHDAGALVVYSSYEMTTLKALNAGGFTFADQLCAALSERGVDLLRMVQDCVYMRGFKGSFSIKKVLPAMVPGMSYADLQIQEGETAAVEFKRMIAPTTPPAMAQDIRANLLAYCERDTLAMVKLFWAMWDLCGEGGGDDDSDKPVPDDTQHEQLILNI